MKILMTATAEQLGSTIAGPGVARVDIVAADRGDWFAPASELAGRLGAPPDLTPVGAADVAMKARRPRYPGSRGSSSAPHALAR